MNVKESYNIWAVQYDSNLHKTRDPGGISLRETLSGIDFETCLAIGCGTGKNTEWLSHQATHITAVDLSEGMIGKAREKIRSSNINFLWADINKEWLFIKEK